MLLKEDEHYRLPVNVPQLVLQLIFDLPVEGGKRSGEFVFSHKDKERGMQTMAEKRRKKEKKKN